MSEQKLVKVTRDTKELRTVHGVLVKMVDRAVLNRNYAELLQEDPKGLKEPVLIEKLTEFFSIIKDRCVTCEKCLGLSDPNLTAECPYCGDTDDVQDDASIMIPALEAQVEEAQVRKAKKRKEETAIAIIEDMTPLVEWRKRMQEVRIRTSDELYSMAQLLLECADSHYWRLERDEVTGQLKYRTVLEMFESEFALKPSVAKRLIAIAREFPLALVSKYSREFITGLFHNSSSDTRRELLLAMATEDLTEQQVKERSDIIEDNKRLEREKSKKAKQEALEPKEQLLTLVSKPEKQRVKMFTYADEDKRAKRVNERPVGTIQLERGRLAIEISMDAQGQLEVIVKALPNE